LSFNIPFSPTVPTETLVKGNWYPQLQLQRAKFDPLRGWGYQYRWKGANQTLMLPVFADCANAGMACDCTFEKDMAVLEVTDSTSEYTIDSWEIHANEEVRDLFSLPVIVQAVGNDVGYGANGATDVFTAVREALAANDTLTQLVDALNTFPDLSGTSIGYLEYIYTMYQQGTTGFRRQQYVLKHKTNVSNRWSANIADYGIDNIYTPAQLISEVTNYGLWIFPLPDRLVYKLLAIPVPVSSGFLSGENYLWGWLKSGSTETTEALNRINIETDYVLELWNLSLYPAYPSTTAY
jgi:hypothetical protein